MSANWPNDARAAWVRRQGWRDDASVWVGARRPWHPRNAAHRYRLFFGPDAERKAMRDREREL